MDMSTYLALLGVALVLAITPGPDTLLTLQYALRRSSAGVLAALGAAAGVFVWAALVAGGVAALLQDSPIAFDILRVLGGAYLFYLGYRSLTTRTRDRAPSSVRSSVPAVATSGGRASRAGTGAVADAHTDALQPRSAGPSRWAAFGAGVLCCLTNPKTGLFFLALVPQFTPLGAAPLYVIAVIGGTVAGAIGGYLAIIALGAHTAGTWLNRPTVTRWIHRISGVVFVALGLTTTLPVITALL